MTHASERVMKDSFKSQSAATCFKQLKFFELIKMKETRSEIFTNSVCLPGSERQQTNDSDSFTNYSADRYIEHIKSKFYEIKKFEIRKFTKERQNIAR